MENFSVAWIWAACAVVYPVFIIGIGAYRDWARAKAQRGSRIEIDSDLDAAVGAARARLHYCHVDSMPRGVERPRPPQEQFDSRAALLAAPEVGPRMGPDE